MSTGYKQLQVEIGKNQANPKQHPEAELLLPGNYSGNYSHLSSTLLSKIIVHNLKNKKKKKYICKRR